MKSLRNNKSIVSIKAYHAWEIKFTYKYLTIAPCRWLQPCFSKFFNVFPSTQELHVSCCVACLPTALPAVPQGHGLPQPAVLWISVQCGWVDTVPSAGWAENRLTGFEHLLYPCSAAGSWINQLNLGRLKCPPLKNGNNKIKPHGPFKV